MSGPSCESPVGTIRTFVTKPNSTRSATASRAYVNRSGLTWENPPPMATTSRSTRLVAAAIACPRARPLRLTAATAISSPAA
ncbi:hypothetical protein Cus16_0361 [Curtobacterium sp. ER1/6]|nr:hypothetical protein Cus16_0361 [Curtobacterium sp. ER1/6]